jgi:hypothetical protein
MALSEPLVLVAVLLGAVTGLGTRLGGGTSVPVRQRRAIAVAVALIAVAVAEFIVWRLALAEGGVLGFVDYQLQVFGPVAILQPIAAGMPPGRPPDRSGHWPGFAAPLRSPGNCSWSRRPNRATIRPGTRSSHRRRSAHLEDGQASATADAR